MAKSKEVAELLNNISGVKSKFMVDGTISGYESYEEKVANYPSEPIADEMTGSDMLYSSGTTGRAQGS